MSWDHAQGLADKHSNSSNGLFVRLANDRDKVVGVFVGEPFARETHWTGERYEECIGTGCSYCKEGKRPNLRVLMNFYLPVEKELKIIEGGTFWFKDLLKARDKYGLTTWMFEVERHGDSGNAKTKYSLLPEEKLSAEQIKEIGALKLHDLAKSVSGGSDFNTYDKGETIEARTASQFVSRLKALPREAVDVFLEKFGISRVREVKASQEQVANTYIERLEAKYCQTQAESKGEVDPFA